MLWFSANPNGEAEQVTVHLSRMPRLKSLKIDVDFSQIAIKGRGAAGNTVTKFAVTGKVDLKSAGSSTLGARKVWFDESVRRLNSDGRGRLLGAFGPDDRLLVVMETGAYELIKPELSVHFPDDMVFLDKWHRDRALTVVHLDGEKKAVYVKRFVAESSTKTVSFIRRGGGLQDAALYRPRCADHHLQGQGPRRTALQPQRVHRRRGQGPWQAAVD